MYLNNWNVKLKVIILLKIKQIYKMVRNLYTYMKFILHYLFYKSWLF